MCTSQCWCIKECSEFKRFHWTTSCDLTLWQMSPDEIAWTLNSIKHPKFGLLCSTTTPWLGFKWFSQAQNCNVLTSVVHFTDIFELDDSEENSHSESVVTNSGNEAQSSTSPSPMVLNQQTQQQPYPSKMANVTVAELLSAASRTVQQQQLQLQQQQQQQQQQLQLLQRQAKRKKRKNQKNFCKLSDIMHIGFQPSWGIFSPFRQYP